MRCKDCKHYVLDPCENATEWDGEGWGHCDVTGVYRRVNNNCFPKLSAMLTSILIKDEMIKAMAEKIEGITGACPHDDTATEWEMPVEGGCAKHCTAYVDSKECYIAYYRDQAIKKLEGK